LVRTAQVITHNFTTFGETNSPSGLNRLFPEIFYGKTRKSSCEKKQFLDLTESFVSYLLGVATVLLIGVLVVLNLISYLLSWQEFGGFDLYSDCSSVARLIGEPLESQEKFLDRKLSVRLLSER
jgi:hypothetical protein